MYFLQLISTQILFLAYDTHLCFMILYLNHRERERERDNESNAIKQRTNKLNVGQILFSLHIFLVWGSSGLYYISFHIIAFTNVEKRMMRLVPFSYLPFCCVCFFKWFRTTVLRTGNAFSKVKIFLRHNFPYSNVHWMFTFSVVLFNIFLVYFVLFLFFCF